MAGAAAPAQQSAASVTSVLQIRDVAKRFGQTEAIRGVDLGIDQQEFFALLGPSGSGKTTLLRVIAGLETPDAGRVVINNREVTRLPPYARNIGMVFQDFLLFPHRTVAENVAFPLRMQGRSRAEQEQQLAWVLDLVHLKGLEARYPHQLSGGQKQRVALARGLISRPSVLLLDEPLANLDRELRREMEIEVRRFQQELAIPFVYVTHNQEEALTLSDRIAVMHEGRIEQVGPKLEIYHHPATRFVAGFVGAPNRLRARIAEEDASYARLQWGGIDLVSARVEESGVGDLVDLFVKPERIRITAAGGDLGADAFNQLEGVVRDVIFKGPYLDCLVALPNGREVTVSAPPEMAGLVRGAAVWIGWPPHAAAAFRADGA
jgi:putative spermidine/putrescine transport system ATP-binding protein/spermidine/putrescine transport system ATP-binding protein